MTNSKENDPSLAQRSIQLIWTAWKSKQVQWSSHCVHCLQNLQDLRKQEVSYEEVMTIAIEDKLNVMIYV